ncbi:MAG: SDR family oxidoreductase [Chloroflexi bacterium]|nr:SDR family oxidoreductase [Chloroflexota bacterium]
MAGRVSGKVAIVTGAASGLGAADARRLAEEGARVILTDINEEAGRAIAATIGGRFVRQDVSDEASWPRLIESVMNDYGHLDVLVNNAGIAIVEDIEAATTENWRRTLAVHLDGTFFGCHYAIPAMKASGGGSLINMSSTAALVGIAPFLAYSAAKGGIRSMTKSIAVHCRARKYGIRCNSIHPGSISTPMVHAALEATAGVKMMETPDPEATRLALGIGEPDDVANMVVFLASDESKHITGAELVIDNGDTVV